MKRNLHISIIVTIFFCSFKIIYAQQISINTNITPQQLIEDNLIDPASCVKTFNIVSPVSGSDFGYSNSYAQFSKGTSNFPFENGIVLSTGVAESIGNNNVANLNEGSNTWVSDPDIETYIPGLNNTLNATAIEFDLISAYNQLQFNYLIASEEYSDVNSCSSKDSFVFLIREGNTGPYQNIAVLPSTTTPVSIDNIHIEYSTNCPAKNEQYFSGFNIGDTNFIGRTEVLTASTPIKQNTQYHIKLIIADHIDSNLDSAVFIETNSFNNLDLGNDITTCLNQIDIGQDIQNPSATYQWYLNDTILINETQAITTANQNGVYKVIVKAPLDTEICTEEDEVRVALGLDEAFPASITFNLCDDGNDGLEIFDLTTKTDEIRRNSPFQNSSITYHTSPTSARDLNDSGITSTDNITNPSIYVRVADLDKNCSSFPVFDLIVNTLPIANSPSNNWPICDEDGNRNGFTLINLTEIDSEIIGSQNNLMVTYHTSESGARTGADLITNKTAYINQTTPQNVVFARVTNTITNCSSISPARIVLDITNGPTVNDLPENKQFIDACEVSTGTPATFDLTKAITNIVGNLTNYTPYFYENEDDARNARNNFIVDPENFSDIFRNDDDFGVQELYLRVEDNNTSCASIVPFEIHTNLLLTGTQLGFFALCDNDTDATNALPFNLLTVEKHISNDLPNPVTVTFYTSETRDTTVPKDAFYSVTGNSKLYITLTDGNCTKDSEIILTVNPILQFNRIAPISYCDSNDSDPTDAITDINLHDLDTIITEGKTDFIVYYFSTQAKAEASNVLDRINTFRNTTKETQLFARIESALNGISCHTISPFKIEVFAAPITNQPNDRCLDPSTIEDISTITSEIIADHTGLSFEFFKTRDAANIGDAQIDNSDWISDSNRTSYNTGSVSHEIFIRIENNAIGIDCNPYVIQSFYINIKPNIVNDAKITVCKDNLSADPIINLIDYDNYILDGHTENEVIYINSTNNQVLDKNAGIQSFNGTITVRVQNINNPNCFTIEIIPVIIDNNPIYADIAPIIECIELGFMGPYNFDLESKRIEINNSANETLTITFHNNQNNAYSNILDIPNQTVYSSPNASETFFIRIESATSGCYEIESIEFLALEKPTIENLREFQMCDDDALPNNGETAFNLNTVFDITKDNDNPSNLFKLGGSRPNLFFTEITYYRNQNDIDLLDVFNNSKAIIEPELSSYNSASNIIYVKVLNTQTECFTIFPLTLKVNTPPNYVELGAINGDCYNESNTYDLIRINSKLVSNPSNFNFEYYNTNTNTIYPNSIFTYTAPGNTNIEVRIEDTATQCISTTHFNLIISPRVIANIPPNLVDCDDDFDGFLEFNLSQNDTDIIGIQNPENHNVYYYTDITNAQNDTNRLDNIYTASNNETIYARLENKITSCFDITEFNIIIHPKPIIPIDDVEPLCFDNLPMLISAETGNIGDIYEWDNGQTDAEIAFNIEDLGERWVKVTTPNGCEYTKLFNLIESEKATITITPTVHFADPNSITVNIESSPRGNYVYILDEANGGLEQTSNFFNNVSFGRHLVTVRDLNGCLDETRAVFVFDIPKLITPNNDGNYDTWHIIGIDQLPGTVVYIFNRYGKLLKTLPQTSLGWDGTFNGQNMPSDDYWFSANIIQNGQAFNLRGHFTLKR